MVRRSSGAPGPGPRVRARDGEADLRRLRERPGDRRDHPGGDGHGAQRAWPRGDVKGLDERRGPWVRGGGGPGQWGGVGGREGEGGGGGEGGVWWGAGPFKK